MNSFDAQQLVDIHGSVDAAAKYTPFSREEWREFCREEGVSARPKKVEWDAVASNGTATRLKPTTMLEGSAADEIYLGSVYGEVSGVLRAKDFPESPQCFIVQYQPLDDDDDDDSSRWHSMAVYRSYGDAQAAILRFDEGEIVTRNSENLAWRVIGLLDVVASGPVATWEMLLDFMLSDHEWCISTEIGSPLKLALHAGLLANG